MSYTDPWETFGEANRPTVTCDFTGSLAADVCSNFGLDCATPDVGGALEGIDIKHMDAMSVIRLSLLDYSGEYSIIYEPIVNVEGKIEFKEIGIDHPSLDIYYTTQTYTYTEKCAGVMVTGKNPLPYRHKIVWEDLFEAAGGKGIYSTHDMTSNCNKLEFDHSAVIIYDDPQLTTTYKDGLDNLYEINNDNPYDSVLGYAYKIIPLDDLNDDVSISAEKTSEIPLRVDSAKGGYPYLGELISPPTTAEDLDCWVNRGIGAAGGIEVEIPDELRYETVRGVVADKFLGIGSVYVVGTECGCRGIPRSDADAADLNIEGNTDLYLTLQDHTLKTYKLTSGVHYVVNYEGDPVDRTVKLVFAKNCRPNDNAIFGSKVDYKIWPGCNYARTSHETEGTGTILPTGGIKGVLIEEIWVTIALDTPCFKIVDPDGHAYDIAEDLKVLISPLVITDEPPPVAKDGITINQADSIIDHDPTTTQSLTDTEMEKAINEMDAGSGLVLTMATLDEIGVVNLSRALSDYMDHRDGAETNYVCGPNTTVELGDVGDAGGIVNSISYSYSDRGSYTISVNEGPYVVGGMEGITGGPTNKQAESISAEGVIIQDGGNHIDFKVRVDGFGDVYAINCVPTVLRVGDRVSVSIKNNPVED